MAFLCLLSHRTPSSQPPVEGTRLGRSRESQSSTPCPAWGSVLSISVSLSPSLPSSYPALSLTSALQASSTKCSCLVPDTQFSAGDTDSSQTRSPYCLRLSLCPLSLLLLPLPAPPPPALHPCPGPPHCPLAARHSPRPGSSLLNKQGPRWLPRCWGPGRPGCGPGMAAACGQTADPKGPWPRVGAFLKGHSPAGCRASLMWVDPPSGADEVL